MRFVDEAVIKVRAGRGGDGAVNFYRAPFVPKGGPDGGDGGRGGDVVFVASAQLGTLQDLNLKGIYRAEHGRPGQGGRKSGRNGRGCEIVVPVGTMIYVEDEQRFHADLSEDGQRYIVARGGKGGRGNWHFKSSRNRTPRKSEPGESVRELRLRLELKLLADVGLVGRPNSGKSTLLAALTAAHPVIGAHPFSTLTPALGVVEFAVYKRFIMADIPGLGEGAREGKGLGRRFLKHIERTKLMVILIEAAEPDYHVAYERLSKELAGFSRELTDLPRIVIMSKADLPREGDGAEPFPFDLVVSSKSGEGLEELIDLLARRLGLLQEVEA